MVILILEKEMEKEIYASREDISLSESSPLPRWEEDSINVMRRTILDLITMIKGQFAP